MAAARRVGEDGCRDGRIAGSALLLPVGGRAAFADQRDETVTAAAPPRPGGAAARAPHPSNAYPPAPSSTGS
jgi:hypothetical protein